MRELNVKELDTLIYSIMVDNATHRRRPDYWDDNEDEWIAEFQRRNIKIIITDESDIPETFFKEIGETQHKEN